MCRDIKRGRERETEREREKERERGEKIYETWCERNDVSTVCSQR